MAPQLSLREAENALLEHRHAQRGSPTYGDAADRSLLEALAALPSNAERDARATGRRLGADVYSRRFVEDTLPRALATLSAALHDSGAGALHMESAFHRSAALRFDPAPPLAPAHPLVASAYLEGVLEGFLSTALNCDARATADAPHALRVELGAGRDVNARRQLA